MTSRRQSKRVTKPANDNLPIEEDGLTVACDFEGDLAILPGEAELIARYFGDMLMSAANDNEE